MKRIALALLAVCVCSLSGCGLVYGPLIDKATDNMIKLMEAQAKIDKERRAESYTIEGRFKSVEMKTEEVPDNDPSKIEKTQDGNKVSVKTPVKKITTCVVTFEDGRQKSFRNVPSREMEKGKRYIITYNGLDEVTGVTEAASN
ncbi:MAG: hypothetical protein K2W95_22080 [Candidatus Obscuribacterales bacterium]|nr:hypothetical protein [Candidatus Obscuribacterales bacterium]